MSRVIKHMKDAFICIRSKLIVSLIVALLLELVLNFPVLTQGYQSFDISENTISDKGQLVYESAFESPIYINKLHIQGDFFANQEYKIKLVIVNDFGMTETLTMTDDVYAVFKDAYTNIKENVQSIKVIFSDAENLSINEITLSNTICFSGIRYLFWACVCFILLLIWRERQLLIAKPEVIYTVFAICFGILLIICSGPRATTWDEEVHYGSVYRTISLREVEWNQAALQNTTRLTPDINTAEELELLKTYMNQQGGIGGNTEAVTGMNLKNIIVYFPMILSCFLGKIFDIPYIHQYNLGRFGNLLFCTWMIYMAIKTAKRKQLLIAVVSVMPTVLFQSSMYTYDGVIYSCMMLGFVLWMNEMEEKSTGICWNNLFKVIILFAVSSIAKPVYAPMFLLLIPLMKPVLDDKKNRRMIIMLGILIIAAVIILAGIYLMPIFSHYLSGNMSYGGDVRGGETGIIPQFISILKHPVAAVKMLVHEIFTMDNFRNFSAKGKNQFMVGNLMYLNLYGLGILKDAWSLVLLPLLLLLFFGAPVWEEESDHVMRRRVRTVNQLVVILCVVLIWFIMYLSFTPIGSDVIEGVQARYYLPLILPATYAIWNKRIIVQISKERFYQMAMTVSLILTGTCMYQCLICGRIG